MYLSAALPASDVYSLARVAIFTLTNAASQGRQIPTELHRLLVEATTNNPLRRVDSIESFLERWVAAIDSLDGSGILLHREPVVESVTSMRTIDATLLGTRKASSPLKLTSSDDAVKTVLAELDALAAQSADW
ncbi:MAG: hypothetical protein IPL36_09710 [Nigerium sp.]|nr:hypothetical protein [Nigerium sp.]